MLVEDERVFLVEIDGLARIVLHEVVCVLECDTRLGLIVDANLCVIDDKHCGAKSGFENVFCVLDWRGWETGDAYTFRARSQRECRWSDRSCEA